jgi:hypothetical protein
MKFGSVIVIAVVALHAALALLLSVRQAGTLPPSSSSCQLRVAVSCKLTVLGSIVNEPVILLLATGY